MTAAATAAGPVLRDIHLPPPASWWPPAPGWWVLCAIVLIGALFAFWKLHAKWRQRRRTAAVLAELDRIAAGFQRKNDHAVLAAELSQYLRRLARLTRPAAVSLSGDDWLKHLDQHGGGGFVDGPGRVLLDAPFRAHSNFDAAALIALVRRHAGQALGAAHA
jgi:Domain of unknown function (DUF4381)